MHGDEQKLRSFLRTTVVIVAILLIIAILLTTITSAQEVKSGVVAVQSVEVNPQNLFVGDVAEVALTLYNPNNQSIKVSLVITDSSGISASPILDVGYIASRSSHKVCFPVKAESPGTHTVEARVNSEGYSVNSYFTIFVEEELPGISFDRNIRLGEVNDVNIIVSSPIKIEKVVIEPLFNSEPDRIFIASIEQFAEEPLKFYADNETVYKFWISFYNGDNYHSYIAEITPDFEESKNVFVNTSMPYNSVYLYDAVPIAVELTNLRSDVIYSIKVEAESVKGIFSEIAEIARLEAGERRTIKMLYSPLESGEDSLEIKVSYEDAFGNIEEIVKRLTVKVLDRPAVSVTSVDIDVKSSGSSAQSTGPIFRPPRVSTQTATIEISISGDISNNGFGKARNVYVFVDLGDTTKDYFMGNIDPSDVESFSIPSTGNERVAKITVEWTNELGETFSFTKEYRISGIAINPPQNAEINLALIIGTASTIILGAFLWKRRKKRK